MHCHALLCGCPASRMVTFFDERLLHVQQELAQAKARILQLERQLSKQTSAAEAVSLLIQDICVVGIIFQIELAFGLLGVGNVNGGSLVQS